jgi:hypothetical protein
MHPAGGAGPAAFAPGHVPGRLPRLPIALVPSLSATTGLGRALPPARLGERACVPPPFVEPLVPVTLDVHTAASERAEQRVARPGACLGRLVYDSLLPADDRPLQQQGASAATAECAAPGSGGAGAETGAGTGSGLGALGSNTSSDRWSYAPGLEPWYMPEAADDTTLVFESRFECGNLRRVVQVMGRGLQRCQPSRRCGLRGTCIGHSCPQLPTSVLAIALAHALKLLLALTAFQVQQYEYDLILQPDLNTKGHTQWCDLPLCDSCSHAPPSPAACVRVSQLHTVQLLSRLCTGTIRGSTPPSRTANCATRSEPPQRTACLLHNKLSP